MSRGESAFPACLFASRAANFLACDLDTKSGCKLSLREEPGEPVAGRARQRERRRERERDGVCVCGTIYRCYANVAASAGTDIHRSQRCWNPRV